VCDPSFLHSFILCFLPQLLDHLPDYLFYHFRETVANGNRAAWEMGSGGDMNAGADAATSPRAAAPCTQQPSRFDSASLGQTSEV
jgi:hypothetical protein